VDVFQQEMEDLHYGRRLERFISHAVDIVQNMPVLGNEIPESFRRQTEILFKVNAVFPGSCTMINNHRNDDGQAPPQLLILEHPHPFLDLVVQNLQPSKSILGAFVLKEEVYFQDLIAVQEGDHYHHVGVELLELLRDIAFHVDLDGGQVQVAFDLLRDVILDKVPDELILAEKALETGIVVIGYLESHSINVG
jgi:hypothetical protein